MLPPKPSAKREMSVNIRFSQAEHMRLKRIADYRGLTVTALLYHVIVHAVVPRLEKEIQIEVQDQPKRDAP